MPIYEYFCEACQAQFEALQSVQDPHLEYCRRCGKPSPTRLVSAAGFRLKGGGWYETDFKKDQDKKKNLVSNEGGANPVAHKEASKNTPTSES